MATTVKLAPHQDRAWDDPARFQVRVWARRSGKTFFTILRQLVRLHEQGKGDWQAFYVAPTRLQAKQIAWPYLTQFSTPLGGKLNISDMRCDLPGKGFIQLMNGEQYDRMRGLYADDVVIDEAADVPDAAWQEVISPMISDRKGRATFMGTPKGRLNLLHRMYQYAHAHPDEWSRDLLTWEDAGMVDPEEIERNRKLQTEAQFNQEWMCSWSGSTPGAYWGKEMSDAEAHGRVTSVKYDDTFPVIAAVDLGHHDLMPVIFCQEVGTTHRIIGCKTYQFTGLPDMVADLRKLPFPIDRMIVPHDIHVTELGSGLTRLESLTALGVNPVVAPKQSLNEGIEATRQFLKQCMFDRDETEHLREGLASYRSDYDPLTNVYRLKPVHDEASHYADAMRYLATGDRSSGMSWGQKPKGRLGLYA